MRFLRFRRAPREAAAALRRYALEPASEFLFDRRPADRREGGATLVFGPSPACRLARREDLTLRGEEVPALTITSDPNNFITVAGGTAPDWTVGFSAYADGQNEAEARERLQHMSMTHAGGMVSLHGRGLHAGAHTGGSLDVDAPADARVVIHASYTAVEVRDMRGPVRIATTHARATVLGTTGQVDASALVVDFAAFRGRVMLSAEEINIKMLGRRFEGTFVAEARHSVRMLVPPGFVTPFEAVVTRPEDFVCRADVCSGVRLKRDGALCIFTYAGGSGAPRESILRLRSEQATVVIDSTKENPPESIP